ncbi:MAG: signal peptidase I [Acidobacteria bacterium]|nr:signal peptidase I [Acidobacteriota bacterium]
MNAAGTPKSTAREYFESIVIAVILALFVRTWCFQAFKIPSGSMENNLLIGDHLVVNKFLFAPAGFEKALLPIREYRRGDVVVFKSPEDPERDFIKRVIGLPGETLEMRHKKIFINGTPIEEPYAHFRLAPRADGETTAFDKLENYGPVTVPAGHLFAMGDNRDNSQDSRYWGFLPQSYVKGRALVVYWSFESEAADYERPGLEQLFSSVTGFVTKTRWSRMGKQIH